MSRIEDFVNKILCGDALSKLKELPDESIDMVITSPPYYALRNYQIDGQIGLESTFEEYLEKILTITAEIKRVLKKSGQFWLNLGDIYGGNSENYKRPEVGKYWETTGLTNPEYQSNRGRGGNQKCLLMMPERIALAMLDGQDWILRNKVKWAKQILVHKQRRTIGSVMPTSVKDRFNESGEELYFFVKNKKYYSDLNAVRLPNQVLGVSDFRENRGGFIDPAELYGKNSKYFKFNYRVRDAKRKEGQPQFRASDKEIKRYNEIPEDYGKKKLQSLPDKGKGLNRWMSGTPNFVKQNKRQKDAKEEGMHTFYSHSRRNKVNDPRGNHEGGPGSWRENLDDKEYRKNWKQRNFEPREGFDDLGYGKSITDYYKNSEIKGNIMGKNLPTIWQIQSEPHNFQKELDVDTDHFAIFPQALLEIPIKFGSPKGGIILDPFMGSGQTAIMARKLRRQFIGIELSPKYIEIAEKRLAQEILL